MNVSRDLPIGRLVWRCLSGPEPQRRTVIVMYVSPVDGSTYITQESFMLRAIDEWNRIELRRIINRSEFHITHRIVCDGC